jgi:HD superfamily phosphohydrolase
MLTDAHNGEQAQPWVNPRATDSLWREKAQPMQVATAMYQRLRDPVHDLIEFEDDHFGWTVWKLLESRPFQRLRRVKQLGFSDLVFPGATHSRFAHSVGVFHTARRLGGVLKLKKGKEFQEDRAATVFFAALLHDVGHGPFSHAFEGALGEKGRHEKWTEEIIRTTEVAEILESFRHGLTDEVAAIFKSETPPDIYSSIVSSQFDADRLDYMQRDRIMTGIQGSNIDVTWLLSNLEVASIEVGDEEKKFGTIDTFVLGPKAGWAGEAYVLALFHLYPTVYFHKATRGAEKLFSRLITCIDATRKAGGWRETGLASGHPLLTYLKRRTLDPYLQLDDTVIWGALPLLAEAKSKAIAEDAARLRDRHLLKAIDVRTQLSDGRLYPGDEIAQAQLKFQRGLDELMGNDATLVKRILIDRYERDPYKRKGYDSPKAIERIHVHSKGHPVDLATISPVVAALKPLEIYRVYVASEDEEAGKLVFDLIDKVKK